MSNEVLRPGENARLQQVRQEEVRLHLSVTGAAPLRLLGVLLDESGYATTPAPLLTWRQVGGDVKISLNEGETISAQLHTAAIQSPIQSILFIAAPYGREAFLNNERLFTAIASDAAEPMAIEATAQDAGQQAIALFEIYRHPEQGAKIRALAEFRARPITTLLEQLGVEQKILTDQMLYPLPQGRKTESERRGLNDLVQQPLPEKRDAGEGKRGEEKPDAPEMPRSATIHPFPQHRKPPPEERKEEAKSEKLPITHLVQPDQECRLSAPNAEFGPVRMTFRWHQPITTQSRVKMDVGCLWELQNGKKGQLQSISNQWGSIGGEPYVALSGEMRQHGAQWEESVEVNGNEWRRIKRILFYAAISEGPKQWNPLDARMQLMIPDHHPVTAHLQNANKAAPIAALLLLENRSDQMRVTFPGGYFASFLAMDAAFGFQLGWQQPESENAYDNQKISWQPRAPRGLWENIFGKDHHREAEELMRACLVASAMVIISDGSVNLDERKNIITAMTSLPIGHYFTQIDVRFSLERILRDFKNQRRDAERLALSLLRPLRGSADAKLVILAMRRAAMADGNISIQEERMVERITRFLSSSSEKI